MKGKKNMFEFLIHIYDEVEHKNVNRRGIVSASSLTEATKQLSNFYGEDNLIEIKLRYITNDRVLEIPNNVNVEGMTGFNKV